MNPYRNRGPIRHPDEFYGRRNELAEIRQTIIGGTWVSLLGERRVGKSSILNALRFLPDALSPRGSPRAHPVYVDCQYIADAGEAEVIQFLLDKLEDDVEVEPVAPDRNSLARAVERIRKSSPPRRLLLLLDEVDVLARNSRLEPGFFAFLRAWSQALDVSLVSASRERSVENLVWDDNAGSPFWNLFRTTYIGPFTTQDALELVRRPAQKEGYTFSEEEERRIRLLGGLQPFFLQIACDQMLQSKSGSTAVAAQFEQVEAGFRQEALPHIRYLWDGLPEAERQAVMAFVGSGTLPESHRTLADLRKKGILVEDEYGLRVFSTALVEWIQLVARQDARAPSSVLARWKSFFGS